MRTPALTIFLLLLLAAAPAQAGTAILSVTASTFPFSVNESQDMTVYVQVSNQAGSNRAMSVVPDVAPQYPLATGQVNISSGPLPASADITGGANVVFTYVYTATTCGRVQFSASAMGTDEITSQPVSSSATDSNSVEMLCSTPTPTSTITVTATPQVIEVTPTPGPQQPSAGVRANVFRASTGQPVLLDFAVAHYTDITIRIYNRNGRVIKTIQAVQGPGRYTESWDGRNDQGQPVASGIYIVHFRGKGLDVRGKVAVVR